MGDAKVTGNGCAWKERRRNWGPAVVREQRADGDLGTGDGLDCTKAEAINGVGILSRVYLLGGISLILRRIQKLPPPHGAAVGKTAFNSPGKFLFI